MQAYEKLSTFRGESKFSTWLFRIVQNLYLMRRRKEISYPLDSLEHIDTTPSSLIDYHSPEHQILEKETKQNLLNILSRLPEIYQKPIFLYYFEELSYQEISKKLNLKINTLKSHILRGKEILKRWIYHENSNLPS